MLGLRERCLILNKNPRLPLRLMILTILFLLLQSTFTDASPALQSTLDDANAALSNGDYAAAITGFTAAANAPNTRCAALYGLGVTDLQAKQYDNADAAFTPYLTECETSFRALVMRGEARQQAGRAADALADYQQAMTINPGVLDSYLYERMASLNLDQSIYYLRLATEAARQPENKFALREKLARIYLLIGSPSAAIAEYDALLAEIDAYLATLSGIEGADFDKNGSLRAHIEYAAATIEIQGSTPDSGYARLQHIIATYPSTDSALPALVALVTANQPVDLLTRMRINVLNQNYFPVVDVLTGYLNDPATAGGAPAELYLLLGQAQRGQGDLQGAVNTFGQIRQQFQSDPIAATAALEQGKTFAQAGDTTRAITTYNEVAIMFPQSPEAPEALLSAAETAYSSGNLEQAITLYDQLGQQFPTSEQAKTGLFEIGMRLLVSDPIRAAQFLGRAGTSEGFVWQGKLLQGQGDSAAAQQAWQQGQATEPGTFFALRACELANGRGSFANSAAVQIPTSDRGADKAAVAQWVAQVFNLPTVSADLSPELAANPTLQRGVELWMVGMWEEARGELDALHKVSRNDPSVLLQLAFYYQDMGIHRSSIFAAIRLIYASNQPMFAVPPPLLRLAFPFYYSDLVTQSAADNNLDPLMVAALIRQESSFDATNYSIADARGLMQLVPSTAQDIANQLAWPDYTLDDLFRPLVNIAFGTHYLSAMRAFQGDSSVGALLSYNAGPGAAQSWITSANGDVDLLYQTIDFDETKSYLDIIYVNHFIYQYLYTSNMPTCGFDLPTPQQPTGT